MASTQPFRGQTREGDEAAVNKEVQDLLFTLPKEKGWTAQYIYNYQGVWNEAIQTQNRVSIQKHFKACDTDLILISFPKSGTTWLKALMFSIVNRKRYTLADNPLLTVNPHVVVPFIELLLSTNNNQIPNDTSFPQLPRLFSTHSPFLSLPESIKASKCRIVYICRNPLDNFISLWHYVVKCRPEHLGPLTIEDALDMFCRGISNWGPFWDHVLGYWKASLENPQKVLFLKYEDMKENTISHVKSLAEFLGYPFSVEEESGGVIEEISRFCSFENLKELEPNKTGRFLWIENKTFFRKALVGDWVNYLTPSKAERLNKVVEEKLKGSGLSFN